MSSLRRRPQSPALAPAVPQLPPLDNDDLLAEILLRLPPLPSSLPRASAVSKRWRLLVSDPRFRRRFRIHHRGNAPLLGCFDGLSYHPTLESPNRVPPERFSFQPDRNNRFTSLGCRHGLVLISDKKHHQFVVWDPVTDDRHQLAIPPGFDDSKTTEVLGPVLRTAEGVHFQFQVVFVAIGSDGTQQGQRAITCVYSSETGGWGNLVSTPIPFQPGDGFYRFISGTRVSTVPAVLVGDSLYWQLTCSKSSILEFDFEKRSLSVIRVPVDVFARKFTVMRADGGGLGFLFMSNFTAQLWKRKTDCGGGASWVLGKTIEMDKLLSLNSDKGTVPHMILGFAEENNALFLWTSMGLFEIQLQSLKFKILSGTSMACLCHPFVSVYTSETHIGDEHDGAELLDNA